MPLIQVDGDWSPSYQIATQFGHVLSFPTTLVMADGQLLAQEIVRTLAQIYRYATRQHWRLVEELLDEPLERWEKAQTCMVTDAMRNRKARALERVYLAAYEAEMTEVLSRWGCENAPS